MKKFLISAAVLTCMGSAAYAADEEPLPEAPPPVAFPMLADISVRFFSSFQRRRLAAAVARRCSGPLGSFPQPFGHEIAHGLPLPLG